MTQPKKAPTLEQANDCLINLIRRQQLTADQHEAYQLCLSVLFAAAKKESTEPKK